MADHMILKALKFDTPNNACQSLRIIAELVRREEIRATAFLSGESEDRGPMRVSFMEPGADRKRAIA